MNDLDAGMPIGFGVADLREKAKTREAVLEELYDKHARALYRYALSILGQAEDAEDALQETFVRLARDHHKLAKVRNIRAYLFTSVRNAAYSILRSQRRQDEGQRAICEAFPSETESRESPHALCEAFEKLPVEQREVIVLKVFDGMTFKEIARTVGASINTAASRYRYGIDKLRQALEENNDG